MMSKKQKEAPKIEEKAEPKNHSQIEEKAEPKNHSKIEEKTEPKNHPQIEEKTEPKDGVQDAGVYVASNLGFPGVPTRQKKLFRGISYFLISGVITKLNLGLLMIL